jgi:hypothetical protein
VYVNTIYIQAGMGTSVCKYYDIYRRGWVLVYVNTMIYTGGDGY